MSNNEEITYECPRCKKIKIPIEIIDYYEDGCGNRIDDPEDADDSVAYFKTIWIETTKEELKMLCKNNWELIINKTKIPFFASDDPLIRQLVYNDKRFGKPYVKNYFPLTPRMLMHSEPLVSSNNIRLYKIEIASENVIKNLNRLTLKNSLRFVISRNNDFFQ